MRLLGRCLVFVAAVVACIVIAIDHDARAQIAKTVRIVVPYGPGGTSDIVARALQAPLAKALQRTLVVE